MLQLSWWLRSRLGDELLVLESQRKRFEPFLGRRQRFETRRSGQSALTSTGVSAARGTKWKEMTKPKGNKNTNGKKQLSRAQRNSSGRRVLVFPVEHETKQTISTKWRQFFKENPKFHFKKISKNLNFLKLKITKNLN